MIEEESNLVKVFIEVASTARDVDPTHLLERILAPRIQFSTLFFLFFIFYDMHSRESL